VKVTKSQIIAANPKMNPDVLIPGKKSSSGRIGQVTDGSTEPARNAEIAQGARHSQLTNLRQE